MVLSHLYVEGPASRLELARATGLSAATISNVVTDLLDDGLVAEAGSVDSGGGRPHKLLAIRPGLGHVAGVDIGETCVKVGLFDGALSTVATASYAIGSEEFEPGLVARLVIAGVREVCQQVGVDPHGLLGVGVGVPGAVEPSPSSLVHAPILGWSDVPLAETLRREIHAPLHIDNCARTLGQAEMWRGAGRGSGQAVVALLGAGLGAALTTGSNPFHGASNMASEWGHTVIVVRGQPCRCGSRGCLEAYVGAEAILADYRSRRSSTPLVATDLEGGLAELVARSRDGGAARDALDDAAEYLGVGIANLVNVLSPERVILSGWAGALLAPEILPAVRDAARRHALPHAYAKVKIEPGQLGRDAVALGAATLPIADFLAAGGSPRAISAC